jgi:hypothetical protein
MELKHILSGQTRDTKVEWEGEVVGITFDPAKYTPHLEAQVMALGESEGSRALVPFITELLTAWDITEDGQPFPVSDDAVASLPLGFLVTVIRKVAEDLAADPTLLGTSDAPS